MGRRERQAVFRDKIEVNEEMMDTYEKKYKEALFKAKEMCALPDDRATMEYIFPELKESEDERIRKMLIHAVEEIYNQECGYAFLDEKEGTKEKVLAWLEKQGEPRIRTGLEWVNTIDDACDKRYAEEYGHGEYCHEQSFKWGFQEGVDWLEKQSKQNLADKPKTSFHEGDWIVQENIGTYKVVEVCESWYEVIDIEDNHYSISFNKEYMCHLWTIQDAKDCDILATKWGAFIVKEYLDIINPDGVIAYCGINSMGRFDKCDGIYPWTDEKITPATKEQYNLLFQKMKEAGYEWDAEKKELKLTNDADFEPAELSEDDEQIIEHIRAIIKEKAIANHDVEGNNLCGVYLKLDNWLKSLRPQ